jgi:thiol:disulfide interchange protein
MYAYVVPYDDKRKLNCRAFLGGAKALSDMQTDFADNVGRFHGLERGIRHSKAKHRTISQFYQMANAKAVSEPEIDVPEPNEHVSTASQYAMQVADSVAMQFRPVVQALDAKTKQAKLDKERIKAIEDAAIKAQKEAADLRKNNLKLQKWIEKAVYQTPEWAQILPELKANLDELNRRKQAAKLKTKEAEPPKEQAKEKTSRYTPGR